MSTASIKSLAWINLPELEVRFAFIDQPREPLKRGQLPEYQVTLRVSREELQNVMNILEPYNQQIDAMYPNTPRASDWAKPETVSKDDKTLTGFYLITLRNTYPIKVFDVNNNQIEPAPRIYRGSKVIVNFGILPYELNGLHGISKTRCSAIKVVEMAENNAANPFGSSTGEQVLQAGVPQQQAPASVAARQPYGMQQPQQGYQQQMPQQGYQQPQYGQQQQRPQMPQQGYQQPQYGQQQAHTNAPANPYMPQPNATSQPAQQQMPQQPQGLNLPDFDDDVPF